MTENREDYSTDNILIIKGRFKSQSVYGQLLIIFNNSNNIESHNIVASSFPDTYKLEPHTEWNKYEEFIADIKWKGNFNNPLTVSIIDHFDTFSQDYNEVERLFKCAYDYDYDTLELILIDVINRVVHDKNFMIETVIQEVPQDEYAAILAERDKPKTDSQEEQSSNEAEKKSLADDAIMIAVKPILSPVKGTPLYALKIGDKIMVNIESNTDRASYVIDLLDLRFEDGIRPVAGKVIDVKAGTTRKDPTVILTEISPNIYGKFFEDQHQVKLKMFNPSEYDTNTGKPTSKDKEKESGSRSAMVMTTLLLIMVLVFILVLAISWF